MAFLDFSGLTYFKNKLYTYINAQLAQRVKTVNGNPPDVNGNVNVATGGGSSYGMYRLDATIPTNAWVSNDNVYNATITNELITSTMDGVETWFDDEAVVPSDIAFTTYDGYVIATTSTLPTSSLSVHISLATNGSDVLQSNVYTQGEIAIVQTGTTATVAIEEGKYVSLNNMLYKTIAPIAIGDLFGSSNLASVSDGAANDVAKSICSALAIVEDTDTAVHGITKGCYVIWKGVHAIATANIEIGDTLSSSNLDTSLSSGIFNNLVSADNRLVSYTAYLINRNKCSSNIPAGAYVVLRNSLIEGRNDGAYVTTQAVDANTEFISDYLSPVGASGYANHLNSKIATANTNISNINSCVAYVENGNTSAHAYSKDKCMIWKGSLYVTSAAISAGDTLSTSTNLTAIPNALAYLKGRVDTSTMGAAVIASIQNALINRANETDIGQVKSVRCIFSAGSGVVTAGTYFGFIKKNESTFFTVDLHDIDNHDNYIVGTYNSGTWTWESPFKAKTASVAKADTSYTYNGAVFFKSGGTVIAKITGFVSFPNGAVTKICTIPTGFRPSVTQSVDVLADSVAPRVLRIYAYANGDLSCYNYGSNAFSNNNFAPAITYVL